LIHIFLFLILVGSIIETLQTIFNFFILELAQNLVYFFSIPCKGLGIYSTKD